ncbi:MAG: YCF48-related protein [Bacteroidia bacterium]|nr:YCF48-related protein [Bacteroidia bacterium]
MTALLRNTKMEKLFLFLFFISATLSSLKAQTWQTPLQAGGSDGSNYFNGNPSIFDVFFTSATHGWAVGDLGRIFKTSNGGTTWTEQTSGTTQTLNSVFFTSATQGWAVGNSGTILTTGNGGTTWTAQTSGTTQALTSVYFTSANQGCVVGFGGAILTTGNGGTTWTARTSGTSYDLNSVYFTSATQGWAVGGYGTIRTTSNGGTTWTAQTSVTINTLRSVHFSSASKGWAAGDGGSIQTTSNGGTTWVAQTSGTTQSLFSVNFTSASQGWAVGISGTILTTSNGGTSWTAQTSGTNLSLRAVYFTSASQGWAVGISGTILTTSNGGTAWTAQTSGTTQFLSGVYFVNATQGWAVGGAGTIRTTNNGGITWTAQTSGTTNTLNGVYFISATQGWAVGNGGTIRTTNNGGITWTAQTSGTTQALTSVYFISATQGWAVGINGTILTTSNGGTSWTVNTIGISQVNSVYFTSANQGWAVGSGGTILTTSNGGTTWSIQTSGTTQSLNGVHFTSATQGWVVGGGGTILTTSNGGTTWSAQTSGTTQFLRGIYFVNATQGWAVGFSGTIITTSNGGTTWSTQTSGTTQSLFGMYFTNATKGWAVGGSGTILLYSSSASTPPVVSTSAAGSISAGAATLGGNATDSGSTAITQRGIVYATTANPTLANTKVSMGNGLGNFSQNVTGLSAATLYHFRAFAINSTDTAYGADRSFTTLATPPVMAPTVTTASASLVGTTNATLGGNVSDSGTATVTERGIVYATTANPTTANTKVAIGSGVGNFSQNVSGLTASTTYHVRAYAINSVGTSYGGDSTFTTLATTPVAGLSVVSYAPQSGNVGSTVALKGTGFVNVTKVWFGPAPAASFTVVNDSTINAVVPNNAYMGNIAVATTTGFKIGKEYFYVKNPQNVMIGNTGQTGAYFLKDGKLYGQYIYYFDNGQSYRYCPVEMPPKGSLRGKTISQLSTSGTWNLIALASDNTVHTQGNNNFRQLGDSSMVNNRALPTDITNKGDLKGKTVIQVLAGSNRFYALTSDGIVCSWGKDTLGSLGNGASTNGRVWTPTSIASRGSLTGKTIIKLCKGTDAVNENNVFAIASDGTVHGWGPNLNSSIGVTHSNVVEDPVQITQNGVLNGKTIVDIDSKNSATILQDEDGILYGMGSSMNLGLSGATIRTTPDLLNMGSTSSLNNNRVLSMILNRTAGSAIVVDTAGKVHAFGNNASAHLGTGNSSNAIPPVLVEASTSSIAGKVVVGLAQTNYAYYVTTSDNQMHVFGSAGNYQLMNGLNSPNAPIAQLIGSPKPVPSIDATNLAISNITSSSATIKCTPGSGVGRMIVVKANNKIDTIGPANGVNYIPSTSMNGSVIDTSARVVYRGYGDSVNITNLVNGTLYHVSVFEFDTFSNPCRYDIFKLGTPLMGSFIATSGPQLATVRTSSATLITTNSATLGGNVTADGGASVTERGIVYATTANPTTANTKIAIGSGIGAFSQNVSGLTASTTYHVRAYAINSVGTSYGADSTFTTDATPVTSVSLNGTFDPFNTCEGTASDAQQFTVSGINLNADVIVNAAAGFELSLSAGGTYSSSLNLTPVSGTLATTTIYIRISSAASGNPSGNITATSTGALAQNLAINGTVNPVPAKPVISMQAATPICAGANQLNYGAANEPATGISYQWSATNASVYAQGSTKQYAIISFPNAGSAKVILTASNGSCSAATEVDVTVQNETTHEATVRYFNNNFVCQANQVSTYQWGYDDKPVLKGNLITGEINQNYFNASPDLTNKSYWVISTKGNCYQKTYYNAPSGLNDEWAQNNTIKVFPNPFVNTITITAKKGLQNHQISIIDAQGKLLSNQQANGQSLDLNLSHLSSGIYFINVQDENGNISNIKMVKH